MPTLNYTTKIGVVQTVSEIQKALASHGATRIATDYTDGKPSGIAFALPTPAGTRLFNLPVNVPAVAKLLADQREGRNGYDRNGRVDARPEQAERVAWRVTRDWLLAQLAIIEAQMATLDQIMLPYMQWDADRTLYDAFRDHEVRALESNAQA